MRFRILILFALSCAMAWGGYTVSNLRGQRLAPIGDVLAAAGAEPGDRPSSASQDTAPSAGGNYHISALSVFSNVALHVKENYVDPARISPKEMLVAALNQIEREVPEVLVEDLGEGKLRVTLPGQEKIVTVNDVESLWEINLKLREVFRFFEKHLPPQKDIRAVEYAAINGALSTLDPHSVLLKPDQFNDMKTSTKGEFGGLGIVISIRDGKLTIMSPLDGTPASRAGLKAMDVITRINDVSTVSMAIEEAVQMLRGPEGSRVTIFVERKGWPEPRKFTLTRQRIKIESVESKMLADRVGYIKIKNFQQNTGRDLDDQLAKLEKDAQGGLKGLVLDLRNNPGGLLEQAIKVSDKFVSAGDIVTTVGYGNKLREPKRAQWSSSDSNLPLVVLVNNGSASASEIVAGALKNLQRAVIVGQRTFGKGSVQVLYDFADNSALKLTIAQYLTPGGISIQNVGVAPDIEIKPAFIEKKAVRLYYEADGHREKNLEKHLERAKTESPDGKEVDAPEGKPEVVISYLVEPAKKKEEPEPADDDEEAPPANDFKEDFPIKFAREMVTAVGRSKRPEMLDAAGPFLKKRQGEEEAKITAAIEALGIEWGAPEGRAQDAKPAVAVEMKVSGGDAEGRIAAGSEVTLDAKVTNTSNATLHRVRGLLDTENPAFQARELLFGKLAPGQSRSWQIVTKIPKEASSRSDLIKLKLDSAEGPIASEQELPVMIQYVAHPQFAFSYAFDDTKRGDGDGVLEKGEGVDMVVYVTNVGGGEAEKLTVKLKNGAGEDLFLEHGRVEIGALPPGATKSARLRFKVKPAVAPEHEQTGLPVELSMFDQGTGEWIEDQFSVYAENPAVAKVAAKKGQGAIKIERALAYAAAVPTANVIALLPKGTKLKYEAVVDGFLRATLPDEGYAWVREEDVGPEPPAPAKGKKPAPEPAMAYQTMRRAPTIAVDGELGGRSVDADSVVLSGKVTGRELRDMQIFLNDKKVMYSTPSKPAPSATMPAGSAAAAAVEASKATKEAWTPPDEAAVVLPFRQTLALQPGVNKILVVARLDEKVVSYRNLFVSRTKRPAPAVAEAVREQAPAKKPAPN